MGRLRIRDDLGIMREIKRIRVRDAANQSVEVQRLKIKSGGVLRTIFSGATVTITPSPVDGLADSATAFDVPTSIAIGTMTGGVAPYTYAWTIVVSSPYEFVINSGTTASTYFTAIALPHGTYAQATARLTITDATGQSAYADVIVTARNGYTIPSSSGISNSGPSDPNYHETAPPGGVIP